MFENQHFILVKSLENYTNLTMLKIFFIGGTNLRLVKGIDRFSEDLDFDCKNFYTKQIQRF